MKLDLTLYVQSDGELRRKVKDAVDKYFGKSIDSYLYGWDAEIHPHYTMDSCVYGYSCDVIIHWRQEDVK